MDSNQLNELINHANDILKCDESCQKEKQIEMYKQKLIQLKESNHSFPLEYENAMKEYLLLSKGQQGYEDYYNEYLHKKAEIISNQKGNEITNQISEIKEKMDRLQPLSIQTSIVNDLYSTLQKDNNILSKNKKTDISTAITNDRKSFYLQQKEIFLQTYSIYFYLFYYLLFIGIVFLIQRKQIYFKRKIVFYLLLFILPFINKYIIRFFLKIYHYFF
jgi:hypothetical protein